MTLFDWLAQYDGSIEGRNPEEGGVRINLRGGAWVLLKPGVDDDDWYVAAKSEAGV